MQRIPLKKARPGMLLAQAVVRPDGIVLMGEGLKLTEELIVRIRDAGVGTICVEGNPLGGGGTVGDLSVTARNLQYTFRRHSDNVFMMTLRNMIARYLAHRIAARKAAEEAAIESASGGTESEGGKKA